MASLDFSEFSQQCVNTTINTDTVRSIRVPYVSCDNLYVATSATIAGGVTVTNTPSTVTVTGSNNQIIFYPGGTGTQLILTATNPATATRTITFPDPGASASIIYDVLAQTISGVKTFSSRIVGSIDSTGASVYNLHSVTDAITAFATGGQASATQLTTQYNIVGTCATNGDSVKLPTPVVGLKITVRNNGAANAAVFPATGHTINALSANASLTVNTGTTTTFIAISTTAWRSF